ncbi:hypothetical protein SAMN05216474_1571 [Lishizhenia tianjinensis]|uniref:Uncharacterized protein n=1 Tax=Lishizhenia tianjinensis TaxID=477690 RepID=A0A1I6ZRY3_9FLAO|nr:hypothetical protein [Lishizhenia tianjinensis]SFT65357.1 hypothetical protein SAMN05216474_1571 [Lishizhenia tianjinensis]
MEEIDINPGEIKINFTTTTKEKVSLADLGLKKEDLQFDSGHVRMVFDFENIQDLEYFSVPTLEFSYEEEMGETHWQCEYNNTTIVDKHDHHGRSTVVLLNRKKMQDLEQRHENQLILHAEFPAAVQLDPSTSFVNFFKA